MSIPHVLTLMTVLPVVGAAIALFVGRHARLVALAATLASLALSVYVWMHLPAGGGRLTFFAEQIFESGLVFGLAAGARRVGQHARGFGLANALAGVGLDGFCGRKTGWLAFRHGKIEYGLSWAQAEVPKSSLDSILDSNLGSSTGTRGRSRNGKAE